MKLINPVGREVNSGLEANSLVQPLACVCSNWDQYVGGKGNDSCFHCGCACDNDALWAGNSDIAFLCIRTSV